MIPPSRRRRLLLCWAVVTMCCLIRLFVRGVASPAREPFARPWSVDINVAGIPELMALPGMGRRRASAVVLRRVRHGPFRSVDELAEVEGIGQKTVERLREFLVAPRE